MTQKLKSEYDICIGIHKKLNETLEKERNIEKKLKARLDKKLTLNKNVVFRPLSSNEKIDNIINKNSKIEEDKDKEIAKQNIKYHKININRPKSSIRLNKSNFCFMFNNIINAESYNTNINSKINSKCKPEWSKFNSNNLLKRNNSTASFNSHFFNFERNNQIKKGRSCSKKQGLDQNQVFIEIHQNLLRVINQEVKLIKIRQ
jgi:hypothetical protein